MSSTQKHSFHMVDLSPWPFCSAVSLLTLTLGLVMYFHKFKYGICIWTTALEFLIIILTFWWRDIIRESTFLGYHTKSVQKSIKLAMIIFILSEIMFFFGFFWAFFHSALVPDFHIGGIWPPFGINPINPWHFPLANTLILLSSGATLTWAHHAFINNITEEVINGLSLTIGLAILFTLIQMHEYIMASFSINDGIYGSVFYFLTGFHGLHVIIGTIFLSICFGRLIQGHLLLDQHLNFILAAWYWHFVDVVWLFLFVFVYWWGGK